MSALCPDCGLKSWDADDLVPGDYVCTCDGHPADWHQFDDAGHGDDWPPIETVQTTGGLL